MKNISNDQEVVLGMLKILIKKLEWHFGSQYIQEKYL